MDNTKAIVQDNSTKRKTISIKGRGKSLVKCMAFHGDRVYVAVGDGDGSPTSYENGEIFAYDNKTRELVAHFTSKIKEETHAEGVTGIAIAAQKQKLISVSGRLGEVRRKRLFRYFKGDTYHK